MSNDSIKLGFELNDTGNSVSKNIKNVETLRKAVDGVSEAASKASIGRKMAAAYTGNTTQAIKSASQSPQESIEYGQARAAVGTGAAGRDFAKQAQGLGGLVHLYATFAANLFAVSAAFSALKNSADTTALVIGLDKLGASSGKNLGTLSKQLVAATDGAVSLRDAMTATAQTSSAGMSGQNILRLANVAKNASIALGVSMPDALSRLSRGIVKLEPELLDELGIFTKIGPATDKYALELGKATSQLTDFERRQAFANAVLEEGEKKFAALGDAASNPYDRLLSSLKNVGQSGLEVVNKVLTPAVDLLAKSPVALGAGIVAIASILLKQAIPALSQFREGLEKSAKSAGLAAVGKAGDAKRAREQLNSIVEKKVEESANAQLKTFEDMEAKLYASAEKGIRRRSSLYQVLKKDIVDITDADIASAEKSVKALESKAKKDPTKLAQAGVERQTLTELQKVIDKEDELVKLKKSNREAIEKNLQGQTQYARIQKAALDYETAARKQSLVSNAAYNASLLGIRNAFTLLKEEIALSGLSLTKIGTGLLYVRAGMASLVAVAATLGTALNTAFLVFSSIAAVFGILDSLLSTSSKQTTLFSNSIDAAEGSLSNVERTLDSLNSKGGFTPQTIQSTYALSNALTDLSDSANNAIKSAEKAKDAMGVWDKIWNSIFSVVNLDIDTKLSKTISEQISSAIKLLRTEGLNKEYEELLKTQLKISTLDPKSIAEAFNKLSNIEKIGVGKTLDSAKLKLGNLSSELQGFKTTTEAAVKSYKELIQTTANTNPLFKVGEAFQNVAFDAQKLVFQGIDGISKAFADLTANPDKVIAFGEDFVKGFVAIRAEFDKQKQALDGNASALQFYEDKLMNVNDQLANMRKLTSTSSGGSALAQGTRQILGEPTQQTGGAATSNLEKQKKGLENAIDTLKEIRIGMDTSAIKDAQKLFVVGIQYAFQKGAELTQKALNESYQKAALGFAKAAAGALTGERRAKEENRIAQEELKVQLNAIDVNLNLLSVQEKLVAELQLSNAYQAKANAKDEKSIALAEKQIVNASAVSKLSQGNLTQEDIAAMDPASRLNFDPIKARADRANMEQKAQRALIEGQLKAQKLVGSMAERSGRLEDEQKLVTLTEQINQQLLTRGSILQSISGITTKDMLTQQVAVENANLQLKQSQELAPILNAIANATESAAKTSGESKVAAENEISVQNTLLNITKTRQQLETDNKGLQDRQKLLQAEFDLINKRVELDKQKRDIDQGRADAQIEIKEAEFSAYSSLLGYSEKYINNIKLAFELQKSQAEFVKSSAEANAAYDAERAKNKLKLEAIDASLGGDIAGPAAQASIDAIVEDGQRAKARRDTAITQANILLDKNTQIANVINKAGNEQARFNEIMSTSTTFAESLKSVFGSLGESIGGFVTSLSEIAIQNDKNTKALENASKAKKEAYDSKDIDRIRVAEEAYTSQKRKSEKDELNGNIKLVSSAKTMFNEKTLAYKALDKIEKTMHLYRLAMDAKELAFKIGNMIMGTAAKAGQEAADTGLTFAGVAARLPAYAAEIYGKTIGQLGPIAGPAVATALVAAMFGMFGKGSGGTSYTGPTGEEFQKAQGTGQAYDASGNLVDTGYGVFGDSSQKLDSINKSLEVLNATAVKGLDYDNKMLKALNMVAESITGAATQLYSIPGLRQGTNFGTLGGTTSIAAGGLSGALDSILGGLTGGILGGVGSAIFGGGTTVTASIDAAGIQLKGTFESVMNDITGSITQYKDILKQFNKDGGWFGSDSSWTQRYRETQSVSSQITGAIADIFANAKDMFVAVGELSGVTAAQVDTAFKTMSLNTEINLKGLTGEQVLSELNAVISSELNKLTANLFFSFDRFKKFGEDLVTTVVRVIDSNTKVTQILSNLGSMSPSVAGVFNITEALTKAANGLDKFIEQATYFNDNFYSSAEQVIPTQKAVIKQLNALGLSSVSTKAQLKAVVQGLDLTTDSGRATYQAIMDLAPGFIEVTDAITTQSTALSDAATNFREFAKTISTFRDSLLLSASSTATPLEKYAEAKLQFESTYTAALSGDKDAMNRLSGISQTFLDMSKQFYASSDQYTADFNTVLDKLEFASLNASASADVAQLQLDNLSIHTTLLTSINDNIATIAGVPTKANGGRVSGLTLVGEMGPELVDFTTPGQVYNADQTVGMFTGNNGMGQAIGAMVTEIQQLRAEVTQLRKDQQKQTGDLIISNYDSTAKASETIATAVTDASKEQAWAERSRLQIK